MDDVKTYLNSAEEKMAMAIEFLDEALAHIRAGKANPRILDSELGITPENNGEIIRLSIPPLTEERRKALVKQSKQEAENAKVSVRNARRDAIDGLKKAQKEGMPEDVAKDGETSAQKLHDKYMKKIDDMFAEKEKEILTV